MSILYPPGGIDDDNQTRYADRRCLNRPTWNPARCYIPSCHRWNCPLHGWGVRVGLCDEENRHLPQGYHLLANVLFLKRRVPGGMVGPAASLIRQAGRQALPGSLSLLFVHVDGAGGNLWPYPHFHWLLFTLPGSVEDDTLITLSGNVTNTLHPLFPQAEIMEWEPHDNPAAAVVYGYKCRKVDKDLRLSEAAPEWGLLPAALSKARGKVIITLLNILLSVHSKG